MEPITSTAELKYAIALLEEEQDAQGKLLMDQFFLTYESLKPLNILKSTLGEITTSPDLIDNLLGTAMGLTGGYLSRKFFIGSSGNLIRKLVGSLLQFGVTNLVARHSDQIRSVAQFVIQSVYKKDDSKGEKE